MPKLFKDKDTVEYFIESSKKILKDYKESWEIAKDHHLVNRRKAQIAWPYLKELDEIRNSSMDDETKKTAVINCLVRAATQNQNLTDARNKELKKGEGTHSVSNVRTTDTGEQQYYQEEVGNKQVGKGKLQEALVNQYSTLQGILTKKLSAVAKARASTIEMLDKYANLTSTDEVRIKRIKKLNENLDKLKNPSISDKDFFSILSTIQTENKIITDEGKKVKKDTWGAAGPGSSGMEYRSNVEVTEKIGSGKLSGILEAQIKKLEKLGVSAALEEGEKKERRPSRKI